jgi:phosphatidylglycerol:prolipoprotein diacylglycerol transferase
VFAAYLISYGIARFIIEFFRGDADRGFVLGGALSTSQAIAGVMVPIGVGILLWIHRRRQGQPASE